MNENHPNKIDLVGKRFGRLTVRFLDGKMKYGRAWACSCDCGGECRTTTHYLTSGDTKSCGCINRERIRAMASHPGKSNGRFLHGEYEGTGALGSTEMRAFKNAMQRCNNPNNKRYSDWGGRGIEFRFVSFEEFLKEIGRRPSPNHTIDRINNNGHYEIGNVKWSTRSEQSKNKRRNGGANERDSITGRFVRKEK